MRADPELMNIPVVIMTGAVPTLQDFPDDMKYQALLSKPLIFRKLSALSID